AIPAIRRIEELTQTSGAGTQVGRDECHRGATRTAPGDAKVSMRAGGDVRDCDVADERMRRRIGHEAREKLVDRCRLSLELDRDARRLVANGSSKPKRRREAIDEWPKPDALHRAVYVDANAACPGESHWLGQGCITCADPGLQARGFADRLTAPSRFV